MKAKSKKTKKKLNMKVIAGVVGSICVLGFIGGVTDNSNQNEPTSSVYETITDSVTDYSGEITSSHIVKNEPTDEVMPTSETPAESSIEEITTEATTPEVITQEFTIETTSQVIPESTTEEITTTTEAVTEPPTIEEATTINAGEELVWVSETGKKYHSKNTCYPINPDNARQVTKNEAVNELGLEPCRKCYK